MERAKRIRRRHGGAMRQAGILAAAGLYALDHHRERLVEDHRRARLLAERVSTIPGVNVVPPETNIVMIDLETRQAADVLRDLAEHGVLMSQFTPTRIRAVTHLDVDDEGIDQAARALEKVLAG